MITLREAILEAKKNKKAIGHFNVSNLEMLKAVANVARREKIPVIVAVSEGEREFIGLKQISALIKSLREEGLEIFLNADHTHSLDKAKDAVEAGFDSITFDASNLSLEENILKTKEVVDYIKNINPKMLIEGNLDLKDIPEANLTDPQIASQFVNKTKVDLLGPAVGNIQGEMGLRGEKLDIERIKEIRKLADVPLVLHGGSGIDKDQLIKAIDAGISIVHISTEIRLAWRNSLEKSLENNPEEIAPYKIMPEVISDIETLVERKLRIFNRI